TGAKEGLDSLFLWGWWLQLQIRGAVNVFPRSTQQAGQAGELWELKR
ncbi:mCG1035714, partial [Mus musculus]